MAPPPRSGDLPFLPSSYFRDLEQISPGLSLRLIKLVEAEAEHRRNLEQETIQGQRQQMRFDATSELLGMVLAFLITLAFLGAAMYLAMTGHAASSSFLGIAGIGLIVGRFIQGRVKPKR